MKYSLATPSWGIEEKDAAKSVIDSGNCTMGVITKKLEREFADYFGSKYCVMSNSGSSANLLAISSLLYRRNGLSLKKGDTILVPTVSWSTSYFPLHQCGLRIKFIDIDKNTLNIDVTQIEQYITPDVKAILAVNILGNSCDFNKLVDICNKYNIILIEDNCESMGATYGSKYCGTFGVLGSFSSFFSHHICTVEGGFTITNDEELYQIMCSLRAHGWVRELPKNNHVYNKNDEPFVDLYKFVLPGYNLRTNDIFAAIGLEQLKKLPGFLEERRKNAKYFNEQIKKLNINGVQLRTQAEQDNSSSSCFGFAIILEGELKNRRNEFVKYLQTNGVECRPIVAGNFTKNPVINHISYECTTDTIADEIDACGFFIGNNHVDMVKEIDYFINLTITFKDKNAKPSLP